ncbi:MAG TPA: S-layer homology domain-containing protein, partial [Vicinamibacteria bacterium]|nr:S-layer homology domain-containing protein [Vicinamibacteria bacterium]
PNGCVEGATAFTDVPASSPFCPWIEELARRGVVAGCGGGNFCPAQAVSREQMAVFTLRTLEGSTYTPPACVAGSEMYGDVPAASPFCAWIEELTRRGVVAGCGGGDYCPAAPVTREQMSVFLSGTFGLALYGVEPSFFVVNTADDVVDGACTAAHCSLREAVTAANLSPNNPRRRDEVRFAIAGAGPHTLRPSSQLLLPDPVVVDGYSQPGSSPNTRPAGEAIDAVLRVEIDLSAAGAVRLEFDSLVRGLVLNRSGQAGVFLARERSAVEGCFIGTDPAGAAARPNAEGVATDLAFFARNNRVGGLSPAARNLVSGNLDTGVHLYGTLNLVRGNLIGTNRSATGPLANGGAGVYMDGGFHLGNASGNVIGGLERGATNVISGNGGAAVRFSGTCCASFGGASNNRVQANVMGRGAGGVPIPNAAGVAFDVFSASGAPVASNNLIGGLTVAPAGNLIASNTGFGVSTGSSGTAGTRIQGNAILGNGGPGVYLGEGQVTDNVIRGNAQDGVRSVPVLGPTSFTVRRNSIDGNGGLGIDVGPGGVTPNDPGDADGVLNFPVISSARSTGGVTVVTGIVPTTAAVEVDFFGSPAADPSGHGEGLVYLGSAQVSPSTTFTITLPVSLTPGWVVTATSSSGALRTSEFSQATVVTP